MNANFDVRVYMSDRSITQKDLAAWLGISSTAMCRMLQKELSQEAKDDLCGQIDALYRERLGSEEEAQTEPEEEITISENTITTTFCIGDRVKIPSKSGKIGTVADIWTSAVQKSNMYAVDDDDGNRGLYSENQLEPAPIPTEYSFSATIDGNVAVVVMTATQGDREWVFSRGHAHIIHDGEVGLAQAVSYAARRMFENLDRAQESKIYFKEDK